jgi:uncharacterized membrane protein (TIGR02234 family)
MSRLRSRRAALTVGLLGAGLTLLTMSLTWGAVGAAQVSAGGTVLTGREAAPSAFALSLAALAGVGVLLLVGRGGRRVVGVLLVLLGVGTVTGSVGAVLDLRDRTLLVVPSSGSLPGAVQAVSLSPWWGWVAASGGVLVALAGVLAVLGGPGWPEPSARYDGAGSDRPSDPWRALDAGVDPTLDA